MEFKDYMKAERPDVKPGSGLYHGHEYTWYAARKGNEEDGRTLTEGEFDEAVGHVTSFYQSKRAKLKKQLTHWIGKFSIIKQENNVLRRRLIKAQCLVCMYENVGYGKAIPKGTLQDAVQKVERAVHTKEPIQC
jgi:hypothetical protein